MRVALLTILELAAGSGLSVPRAFLHVGGVNVARQQLGLALALGCERIICLARELDPNLLAIQHAAEAAGAQFHAIAAPRAIAGLVTAADDLVVIADGLLVDPEEAQRLLGSGHCVLVQPVDAGIAAGFERLDINHASAGALRIPGRLAERIADLPPDIDAVSTLTRIALQNGVPQRQIAVAEASARRWVLVRSDAEAHALEPGWIAERMRGDGSNAPGSWLARAAARRFGPALLHSGGGKRATFAAAGFMTLLGLGAGWFGLVSAGLGACAVGWIAARVACELVEVERGALLQRPGRVPWQVLFDWLSDIALMILAGWGIGASPPSAWGQQYFAPFMVIAFARLIPHITQNRWARWLDDRLLLAALLLAAQLSGAPLVGTQALALALAVIAIVFTSRQRG